MKLWVKSTIWESYDPGFSDDETLLKMSREGFQPREFCDLGTELWETEYDTMEEMSVSENDGEYTQEILDDDGLKIWDNVKGYTDYGKSKIENIAKDIMDKKIAEMKSKIKI